VEYAGYHIPPPFLPYGKRIWLNLINHSYYDTGVYLHDPHMIPTTEFVGIYDIANRIPQNDTYVFHSSVTVQNIIAIRNTPKILYPNIPFLHYRFSANQGARRSPNDPIRFYLEEGDPARREPPPQPVVQVPPAIISSVIPQNIVQYANLGRWYNVRFRFQPSGNRNMDSIALDRYLRYELLPTGTFTANYRILLLRTFQAYGLNTDVIRSIIKLSQCTKSSLSELGRRRRTRVSE